MARALQTVNGIKPPVATQSRARAPAAVCPPSDRSPAPTVLQVDTTPGDPGPKLAATLWPVGETCRLGSIVIPWDAAQPAKTVQQIARALLPRAAR